MPFFFKSKAVFKVELKFLILNSSDVKPMIRPEFISPETSKVFLAVSQKILIAF